MAINSVTLCGRLARDPEVKVNNNKTITKFTLAVDQGWGDKKTTGWYYCVAFDKTAEIIGDTLAKGRKVVVSGRLQYREFEAKEGGKQRVIEIIVTDFEFADSKRDGEQSGKASGGNAGTDAAQKTFGGAVVSDGSDEIPF